LKRGQGSSALTQLASTLAAYEPVVIPGSAPVLVLRGVDTLPDLLGRLQTLPTTVVVECLQPNYEILFDANELDISSPRDGGDGTTAATLPPGAATAEDNAPLLGVIDTGAHIILPRMKAIVWTNPGEPEPLDGLDSDVPPNGYIDDVRGLDALTAYGNTPPLPAGTVENTNANHGTIVGAIASGMCGASHPPGAPLKIIPCVAIAGGSYTSAHFLLCLKYFLTLAERDLPLVAINASFGTTTEGNTSCEVTALRALRDEEVLFVVAAGARPPDDPAFPGRHRVANVVPVASWSAPSKAVTSTFGKSVAYVAASVGLQPPVMWPFPDPDTPPDLECQKDINDTVSFAVPQVTNLAGRLAASAPTNSLSWFERRNLVLAGGASVDGLKDTTLSGHIVPAADALVSSPTDLSSYFNCTTATAAGRVQPIGASKKLPTGEPLVIQAYNLSCAAGAGKVPVSLETHTCDLVTSGSCKEEIDLEDTGAQGDEISDDGLYGAEWKVPSKGWARFTVTLWPDGDEDTFEVEVQ
jgi:hypothetical protein